MPGARPAGMVCKVAPRLHRPPRPSQLVGVCLQRDQVIRAGYRPDRCGERGIDHNACRVDLRTMPAARAMTLLAHDPAVAARGRAILLPAASSHTCCGRRVAATLLGLALTTSTQPTFSALAAADQSLFPQPQASSAANAHCLSLSQAVAQIRHSCDPAFLSAVRTSGRFLYRGEDALGSLWNDVPAGPAAVLCPEPDLLLPGTYGDEDDGALDYFRALEQTLARAGGARPSTGHIGVARREAAAPWGEVCSIWPLGRPLRYAWPRARPDFWPREQSDAVESQDAYRLDDGLAEALSLGREVLFSTVGPARPARSRPSFSSPTACTGSGYIAIRATEDDVIWKELLRS